ncbi:hypothetical protein C8J57DRAFT_1359886 [Mycena rebaudengoi]|nr:hypothetical protein C8J57DRAFT_1359886 [Mycena rebaudengoi]
MAKKTVRLTADERAICRVRYKQISKTMPTGSTRSTNEICKAIAAHWKDGGALETGSEYSPLLFPFGNQKAVFRHIHEGHVDAADRAIALKWARDQPSANQTEIFSLLGLEEGSENDRDDDEASSDESSPPFGSKRKASKSAAKKPAAKRRRGVAATGERASTSADDDEKKPVVKADPDVASPTKSVKAVKQPTREVKSEE